MQEAWPRPPNPCLGVVWKAWLDIAAPHSVGDRWAWPCHTHLRGARWSPDACCSGVLAKALASRVVLLRGLAGRGF